MVVNKHKDIIINKYTEYNEDERLVSDRGHNLEYLTTMRYIQKFLKPDAKILEIGAATGRYSIALAKMGYNVTAVDLTPRNVEVMKSKSKRLKNFNCMVGDALDLSMFEDKTFDMVLNLGPMYHLFNTEDKHKALSEAIRVAKKGAVIYVSYCNNDTSMYKFFYTHRVLKYLEEGLIKEDYHTASAPQQIFELYRKSDVDELMKSYNVTRLHYVGVDMLSYLFDDSFDNLSDQEFEEYMKFLSNLCEREDCVGLSIHMLDIFRKE